MKRKACSSAFAGITALVVGIVACSNGVQHTASQSAGSTGVSITKNGIPVTVTWKETTTTIARVSSARSLDPGVSAVAITVFDATNGASEGSGSLGSLGSGKGFGGTITVNETGPVVFEALASGSGGSVLDVAKSDYTVTGSNDSVTLAAGSAILEGGSIQGRMLSLSTVVNTIAGSYAGSGSADNSTGISASFHHPAAITTDGTNLYVADDSNNEIRMVSLTPPYAVTTIAGSTGSGYADNTIGTAASFNHPMGITTDGTNLYVSDELNNEIRMVSLTSPYAVTTIAGSTRSGHADNTTGTVATFYDPVGITIAGTNLYITDEGNNEIRMVSLTSPYSVTTIAGSTGSGHADNGSGTSASFYYPISITTDGTNLYVTDYENNEIRMVSLASPYAVTTIAGSTSGGGHADGTGIAASFGRPHGITTDGTNLYVADYTNYEIRKIQ